MEKIVSLNNDGILTNLRFVNWNQLTDKNWYLIGNKIRRLSIDMAITFYPMVNNMFKISKCCDICGKDCSLDIIDDYMIKDELWEKIYVSSVYGKLCMNCCEDKLERKLLPDDILRCIVTEKINPYTSKILKHIKTELHNSNNIYKEYYKL